MVVFLILYAAAATFFHSRPRGRNRDLARFIGRLAQHKSLKDLVLWRWSDVQFCNCNKKGTKKSGRFFFLCPFSKYYDKVNCMAASAVSISKRVRRRAFDGLYKVRGQWWRKSILFAKSLIFIFCQIAPLPPLRFSLTPTSAKVKNHQKSWLDVALNPKVLKNVICILVMCASHNLKFHRKNT